MVDRPVVVDEPSYMVKRMYNDCDNCPFEGPVDLAKNGETVCPVCGHQMDLWSVVPAVADGLLVDRCSEILKGRKLPLAG